MLNTTNGIGLRLRRERQRLGLSQRDFGNQGGVKANAQGMYENGSRSPSSPYFVLIGEIGVDLLFVLTGNAASPCFEDLSAGESDVIVKFRMLPPEDQNAIGRLMTSISDLIAMPVNSNGRDGS